MVDYVAWARVDVFTVESAAHLCAGIDPPTPGVAQTPDQQAAVAPWLQMLQGAIAVGELAADSRANAWARIGDYKESLVRRGDLMEFAESRGERPAFLFWTEPSPMPAPGPNKIHGVDLLKIYPESQQLRDSMKHVEEKLALNRERTRLEREAMERAEARGRAQTQSALAVVARHTELGAGAGAAGADVSDPSLGVTQGNKARAKMPKHAPRSRSPTYSRRIHYSVDKVPDQFTKWADEQTKAGIRITVPAAEDAMRGPKRPDGTRPGGLLRHGVGLSRATIRAWVGSLPANRRALQGVPPSRARAKE